MNYKRYLASWLQHLPVLQLGLSLGVRLLAPQNHIGAMGAIFNDLGQVLLVEHVFRFPEPWGLPGGWVERGESPTLAIQREIKEELCLSIEVKKLLFCEPQVSRLLSTTPKSLGIAFYCRLAGNSAALEQMSQASYSYEILSAVWVDPDQIKSYLHPLHRRAITLGKLEFAQENRDV